jgi:hypothetical protein
MLDDLTYHIWYAFIILAPLVVVAALGFGAAWVADRCNVLTELRSLARRPLALPVVAVASGTAIFVAVETIINLWPWQVPTMRGEAHIPGVGDADPAMVPWLVAGYCASLAVLFLATPLTGPAVAFTYQRLLRDY